MCIRILLNCFIERIKYQLVIVAGANFICHNSSVIEIKNCAEIYLVDSWTVIPLKFRYIRQPFFVCFVCMKLPVQNILCCHFRSGWRIAAALFAAYRP